MPSGEIRAEVAGAGELREGLALVEGFRGDILAWVRLGADGGVERCHLRDPSWFQWPLLEAAIEAYRRRFPICNNPSIAPIPGTISRAQPCAKFCSKVSRGRR